MFTGYSFCLAPTKECQSWLRHGLYVFGGRKKREGKVREKEEREYNTELNSAIKVLVKN